MHMPGHKQGSGAHPAARAVLGDTALRHDFTELEGACKRLPQFQAQVTAPCNGSAVCVQAGNSPRKSNC